MKIIVSKRKKEIKFSTNKLLQIYNSFLFFNVSEKNLQYIIFNKNSTINSKNKKIYNIKCIKKQNFNLKKFFIDKKEIKKIYSILNIEKKSNFYEFNFQLNFDIPQQGKEIFEFLIEYICIKNKNLDIFDTNSVNFFLNDKEVKYKFKYIFLKKIALIKKLKENIKNYKIEYLTQNFIFFINQNKNNYFLLDILKIKIFKHFVIYNYFHPLSAIYKKLTYDLNYHNIYYLIDNKLIYSKNYKMYYTLINKLNIHSKKNNITLNEALGFLFLLTITNLKFCKKLNFMENYIILEIKRIFVKNDINTDKILKKYYGIKYYIYKIIYQKRINKYDKILFKVNKMIFKILKEHCCVLRTIKNKKYFKLLSFFTIKNDIIKDIYIAEFIKKNNIPEIFFKQFYFPYLCYITKKEKNNIKNKMNILIENIEKYKQVSITNNDKKF